MLTNAITVSLNLVSLLQHIPIKVMRMKRIETIAKGKI
jgi:hypothetical protein